MDLVAFAERAEGGFGVVILDVVDPVLDVVGSRDSIHLELCFGAVQLSEKGIEEGVARGGRVRNRSS